MINLYERKTPFIEVNGSTVRVSYQYWIRHKGLYREGAFTKKGEKYAVEFAKISELIDKLKESERIDVSITTKSKRKIQKLIDEKRAEALQIAERMDRVKEDIIRKVKYLQERQRDLAYAIEFENDKFFRANGHRAYRMGGKGVGWDGVTYAGSSSAIIINNGYHQELLHSL